MDEVRPPPVQAPAGGSPADDAHLIRLAREGDLTAWAILVHRHAPRLTAYLGGRIRRPDLVNRLVADAIVSAWRHLDDVGEPAGFPAWFRRQAAAQAKRWSRDHGDDPLVQPWALPDQPAGVAALDAAICALDEQHRLALEQRFRGGLTDEELAEALRLPRERCETLVAEAIATIAAALPPADPPAGDAAPASHSPGLTGTGAIASVRPAGLQPADATP